MRRYLLSHSIVIAAAMLLLPGAALAAEVQLPFSPADVVLGYGVAYDSGTHRGVDLSLAGESEVLAPASGTVVFAGRVPSDAGGTCGAVTIETPSGLRVSLLPFSEVVVAEGSSVEPGSSLGSLASEGDDSSQVSHLHLGLRRGDAYLDPSGYLTPEPTASLPAPTPPSTPTPPAPQTPAQLAPSATVAVSQQAAAPTPAVASPVPSPSPAGAATTTRLPAVSSPTCSAPARLVPAAASGPAVSPAAGLPVPVDAGGAVDPATGVVSGPTPRVLGQMSIQPVRGALSATLLLGMAGTVFAIARQRTLACRA